MAKIGQMAKTALSYLGREGSAAKIRQGAKITLFYFGYEGRAGPIRNIFAIGKVPFEDNVVEHRDWPKMKSTLTYGQLPVIQVGDLIINETSDIIRYASKLAGIYPKDPLEALQVDSLMSNMIYVLEVTLLNVMFSKLDKDTVLKMTEEFIDKKEGKLGIFLERMDMQIGAGSSGYLFEFGLTAADWQLFQAVCFMTMGAIEGIPKTYIRDNFENVEAWRCKLASMEEINARFKDERHPLHNSPYTKDFKYDDDGKKGE